MSELPQDLKPRTKAFALRVIQLYSKLPKNLETALGINRKEQRKELVMIPSQRTNSPTG